MAFESNIPLQREIDALCHKGSHLITDEIPQAAADHHSSRLIIEYIVPQQAPGKGHSEKFHLYLGPHKFRSRQFLSQDLGQEGKKQILDQGHSHAENEEIEDLIQPFRKFGMFFFKIFPKLFHPVFILYIASVLITHIRIPLSFNVFILW